MQITKELIKNINTFYYDLREDENARYKSWEHCYKAFFEAKDSPKIDIDKLSLQLAFYLASWGMYRGSSFLLQKDYRVHYSVVKEIMKKEYRPLFGIKCKDLKDKKNQKLLIKLYDTISNYYNQVRLSVYGKAPKSKISDTLITKVLMGTVGCVPAYDRFFISAVIKTKVTTGTFSLSSVLRLADFYVANEKEFEKVRKNMKIGKIQYPQMKLMDMGFWQMGIEE